MRSVKSLDFDSDNETHRPRLRAQQSSDTMSEARTVRPTPPKKPLRLSLQRAQSLQTVELNANNEVERKRPVKRAHMTEKPSLTCDNHVDNGSSLLIENCRHAVASASSMHTTSSLGRHRHNLWKLLNGLFRLQEEIWFYSKKSSLRCRWPLFYFLLKKTKLSVESLLCFSGIFLFVFYFFLSYV